MNRGAWLAAVHRVTQLDTPEATSHVFYHSCLSVSLFFFGAGDNIYTDKYINHDSLQKNHKTKIWVTTT